MTDEELKTVFNSIDTDGDGGIDAIEFRNWINLNSKGKKIELDQAQKYIENAYIKTEGKMDLEEFIFSYRKGSLKEMVM